MEWVYRRDEGVYVGGALGCEGAMQLQWLQLDTMVGMMPGQNTDASALEIIEVVPWWAVWSADKQSGRRDGGIT